ncbi:MAG: UrcA family protein [Sphingomonadales bacterium]|nr:UrcA family protein [Sphingomonadales bacterium]NCQ20051.1 UrcA family protein [Sphingomonadales bacterium]NCT02462.1 UrcA family protein [Sphingomonadales bacterium]
MTPLAKTFTHALTAIGLAGAAISPALAGNAGTMTISVTTSDIDLATPEGQKILDQRVKKAVRSVCRATSLSTGSRIMNQDARACLAKAHSSAEQQIAALTLEKQRGG